MSADYKSCVKHREHTQKLTHLPVFVVDEEIYLETCPIRSGFELNSR